MRIIYVFFFFKQKTAYEMRISDWSSDVCSSDLADERRCATRLHSRARRSAEPARRMARPGGQRALGQFLPEHRRDARSRLCPPAPRRRHRLSDRGGGADPRRPRRGPAAARKSAVSGKRGSVRVDLGGRRIIKKKKNKH